MTTEQTPADLQAAHDHAFRHRAEIERSAACRCFHCGHQFKPSQITEWVDAEQTALCPACGIDAVVGDASGIAITDAWYRAMDRYWFGVHCQTVLQFYADPRNWERPPGFRPSPIEADRGARARAALKAEDGVRDVEARGG